MLAIEKKTGFRLVGGWKRRCQFVVKALSVRKGELQARDEREGQIIV